MAGRLQDAIQRGLSGARPAATTVASGTVYHNTDLATTVRASDTASGLGGVWEDISDGGGGGGGSSIVSSPLPFFTDIEEPEDPYIIQILQGSGSGSVGPTGPIGPAGLTGPPGMDGNDGEDGLDSYVPGPAGLQGSIGLTGPTGPKGDSGIPGIDAEEPEYPYIIPGPAGPAGSGGSGTVLNNTANGRLTVLTGVAVPIADVTGAGTIYYTPYNGNQIALYDGAAWNLHSFTERNLALTATSGLIYDVFMFNNAGTLTLETQAWRNGGQVITNATNASPIVITANAHGLSNGDEVYISGVLGNLTANGIWIVANQTANTFELTGSVGSGAYTSSTGQLSARITGSGITLQDGVYVKAGATTRRYLGSFRASGSNVTADAMATRYVWNLQNRVRRTSNVGSATSHTYNSATVRSWNNDATIRTQFIVGLTDIVISYARGQFTTAASASAQPGIGAAYNTTVTSASPTEIGAASSFVYQPAAASASLMRPTSLRTDLVYPGLQFFQAVEFDLGGQTSTFSNVTVTTNLDN